jgi:hypothetical protein
MKKGGKKRSQGAANFGFFSGTSGRRMKKEGEQPATRKRSFWGWGYEDEHHNLQYKVANDALWGLIKGVILQDQVNDEDTEPVPPTIEQIAPTLRPPRIPLHEIPFHLRDICSCAPQDR